MQESEIDKVIITHHRAGFFSNCSVRLHHIVHFINEHQKEPAIVDSSIQFLWYKIEKDKDITFDYFEDYHKMTDETILYPISYKQSRQYSNYSDLDYKRIVPLIKKYFSPTSTIKEIMTNIEKKYNLVYENICVLFYRGNDKHREIEKCSYDSYVLQVQQILTRNPNVIFLVQSDETEFIDFFTTMFPTNSFYFKDEIRHMKKCNTTVDKKISSENNEFSKKYLAITIIMSKCKYIICGSGNCDMWIMLYRGNNQNVIQNLKGCWYNSLL